MRKILQIQQAVDAYQNVKTHVLMLFVQACICVFVLRDMSRIEPSQQTYVSYESDTPAPHLITGWTVRTANTQMQCSIIIIHC
jgi:hypothetical protein